MQINRNFWVIFLIICLSVIGLIYTDLDIFIRILILCILIIIFTYIWTNYSLNGMDIIRNIRGEKYIQGNILEEKYELINHSKFNRHFIEINVLTSPTLIKKTKIVSRIGPFERRTFSLYMFLPKRGEYTLGDIQILIRDPFELFLKQVETACRGGASGVAAGRAVWKEATDLGNGERLHFLQSTAMARMQKITQVVGDLAKPWTAYFNSDRVDESWFENYPGLY